MRSQGKLTSWNDEKGFGFITPDGDRENVFVHIKSFVTRSQRPEVDQILSYILSSDHQGRPYAVNVAFLGEKRSVGYSSVSSPQEFFRSAALRLTDWQPHGY